MKKMTNFTNETMNSQE